jgi:acyl phosphate:glycerol-3-phosphate acyltransferase
MLSSALTGYLLGSLPTGYLLGRWFGGVDLRAVGSQNVGATNMYRASGLRLGLAVMAIDIVKGGLAVMLALRDAATESAAVAAGVAAGVAAVTGHVYPVWLRGHGGKGVATACGAFVLLAPLATAVGGAAFALTVWVTRLVSLGSIVASVALPVATAAGGYSRAIVWGATLTSALVLWRHRANVVRLWRGTERRLGRTSREHA